MNHDKLKGRIDLSHGSGGRASAQLIDELFLKHFDNLYLNQKEDQASLLLPSKRVVMSVDSHVVKPLFFPGGDIGTLSINGTVNDIAMSGAKPLYFSASFILEEGLLIEDLTKIVKSMAESAKAVNVVIVAGDTKVVERGHGDGVYITTTGLGMLPEGINLSTIQARPGDRVLVSGFIGDHGIAVMSCRENLHFHANLVSDCAPLNELVERMITAVPSIRCMRDPTRGGIAAVLNEWATHAKVGFFLDEAKIPIRPEVQSACELLGLDPFYVANEGKLLAVCPADDAEKLCQVMRSHPLGKQTEIIGEVIEDPHHFVQLKTTLGGNRIIDWLVGEQLPRIC